MTFLSWLVTSRNLLFGVFLPRKIITILQKIAVNFRQVSLFWNVSAKSFKTVKRVNPLLHMNFFASDFKVFQWDFFSPIYLSTTYLQIVCFSSMWHTYCVFDFHIYKRYYFPTFTVPEMESKRKISLRFWITFAA